MTKTGLLIAAVMLSACICSCGGATDDQLRIRAAHDLNCPESEVKIAEIDDRTRGVVACGQRMTYVEVCQPGFFSKDCTWTLDTDSKPVQPQGGEAKKQ